MIYFNLFSSHLRKQIQMCSAVCELIPSGEARNRTWIAAEQATSPLCAVACCEEIQSTHSTQSLAGVKSRVYAIITWSTIPLHPRTTPRPCILLPLSLQRLRDHILLAASDIFMCFVNQHTSILWSVLQKNGVFQLLKTLPSFICCFSRAAKKCSHLVSFLKA